MTLEQALEAARKKFAKVRLVGTDAGYEVGYHANQYSGIKVRQVATLDEVVAVIAGWLDNG